MAERYTVIVDFMGLYVHDLRVHDLTVVGSESTRATDIFQRIGELPPAHEIWKAGGLRSWVVVDDRFRMVQSGDHMFVIRSIFDGIIDGLPPP